MYSSSSPKLHLPRAVWAPLMAQMVKTLPPSAGDSGFNPWMGKVSWRRQWQPTPVFLPGECHEQRRLVATVYGVAKSQTQLSNQADTHTHTHTHTHAHTQGSELTSSPLRSRRLTLLCVSQSLLSSASRALWSLSILPWTSGRPPAGGELCWVKFRSVCLKCKCQMELLASPETWALCLLQGR